MAFESALEPCAEVAAAMPATGWTPASTARLPRSPRLASLGPVLLVTVPGRDAQGPWQVGVTIDGDGVREWIDLGPCLLFRLPDSDYHAWERLAHAHASIPAVPQRRGNRTPGRALVVAVVGGQWRSVLRLSAWGWEQAQRIARLERVRLQGARAPAPAGPVPP